MKPKYFYHLTDWDWGESTVLHPRFHGHKRDPYESDYPRICVSSSIAGCFVAVYLHELNRYNIYRTKEKVVGTKPRNIPDHKITNEFWLTDSTEFIFYKNIDKYILKFAIDSCEEMVTVRGSLLGDGEQDSETWQKDTKKKLIPIFRKCLSNKNIGQASKNTLFLSS